MPDPGEVGERSVRVLARVVTYGLVAAIALAVAVSGEWWPVSSMRLFSEERSPSISSWEVDLVDASGAEHRLDLGDLGPSFAGLSYFARHLPSLSTERLDEICRAWADEALRQGHPRAESVRLYRVRRAVPRSAGEPNTHLDREPRYDCAGASP